MDHGQGSAGEVAEAVGEIRIVALYQCVEAEAAILPEDNFTKQEVTQAVHAHHLLNRCGADDVAARLAHLVVLKEQPAVREDALGQVEPSSHQEGGPEYCVKANDLFSDEVQVGRPEAF